MLFPLYFVPGGFGRSSKSASVLVRLPLIRSFFSWVHGTHTCSIFYFCFSVSRASRVGIPTCMFSATIMLARRLLLAASSRPLAYRSASVSTGTKKRQRRRSLPDDGVQLSHFISGADAKADTGTDQDELSTGPVPMPADLDSSTNHLDYLRGQVLNAEEEKPSQPQPQPQRPRPFLN